MSMGMFITGATGKTGRAFLDLLGRDGTLSKENVTCLLQPGERPDALAGHSVRTVIGDASDPVSITEAYGGESTVVHISSILHAGAVIEGCRDMKRFIVVSSTGRYSSYRSYAGTIARQESLVERCGVMFTILRPTMIYGTPDDRNISRLIHLVNKRRFIPLPAGIGAVFQPVHVEDLAAALLSALQSSHSPGRSYNIAGGSAHPLSEMVEIIAGLLDRRVSRIPVPIPIILGAAALLERFMSRPPAGVEQVRRLVEDKSYDTAEAGRDLGFAPISFQGGARKLINAMGLAPPPARSG